MSGLIEKVEQKFKGEKGPKLSKEEKAKQKELSKMTREERRRTKENDPGRYLDDKLVGLNPMDRKNALEKRKENLHAQLKWIESQISSVSSTQTHSGGQNVSGMQQSGQGFTGGEQQQPKTEQT
ncbi:hypothetical protein DLAC_10197 [Tieghemostelium lacteum]|uniref:Uncharacterized protein n=1 Tax=Tieghemostelium lacteum TaxID=361077 RepID=A0A151Z4T8_TIELA|nr:hypothetical protein DLAC_10197 [Tieghemostelium lacteum]|eukprot:KYQ88983.1 hypothetical protein DLAC_10197 [Tieghemostelium lacteum]